MTPDITSDDAFERALAQLLSEAVDNGIDPRGSWEIRNGDSMPDWETQIVELTERQ